MVRIGHEETKITCMVWYGMVWYGHDEAGQWQWAVGRAEGFCRPVTDGQICELRCISIILCIGHLQLLYALLHRQQNTNRVKCVLRLTLQFQNPGKSRFNTIQLPSHARVVSCLGK